MNKMERYEVKTYDSIKVGDKATFTKTVTQADDLLFAGISGDFNPVHIDEQYAKTTMFKTRIVHGAYTVSLISAVIGMKLPGAGCIYGSQTIKFVNPVHFGDTLTAVAEVIEKKEKGKVEVKEVFLSSQLGNIAGCVVIEGTVSRNHHIHILRENKEIYQGKITSLKRVKDDVKEVQKGLECGIFIDHFSDIQKGDLIIAYEVNFITPSLE